MAKKFSWKIYMAKRRKRKLKEGICAWCSNKRQARRSLCAACLEKNRASTRRFVRKQG